MGDNSFAPASVRSGYGTFIVQNIASPAKEVRIFHYPISSGASRNLLKIPGVAESDIRVSLLKGELRNKLLANEITIIASDIELIQFNSNQLAFLTLSGVMSGTKIGIPQQSFVWHQDVHLNGIIDGVNTAFTIPNGVFIQNTNYTIIVYLNGVKQNLNDDFTISSSTPAGFDTINFVIAPEIITPPTDVITADFWQAT